MGQTNGGASDGWKRPDTPLATLVSGSGLVNAERVAEALAEAEAGGRALGDVLLRRGWIDEGDLGRLLAGQRGLPFVGLRQRELDGETARLLPERVARVRRAVPFRSDQGNLLVAVADPTDGEAIAELRRELPQGFALVVAAPTEIGEALDAVYGPAAGEPDIPLAPDSPPAVSTGLRVAAPPPPDLPASPVLVAETAFEPVSDTPAPPSTEPAPAPLAAEPPALGAVPIANPAAAEPDVDDGWETRFRLVLHLDGGGELDVAFFASENEAERAARDFIALLARRDQWPLVGRTFIRPERVLSVEIAEQQRWRGSDSRSRWGAAALGS